MPSSPPLRYAVPSRLKGGWSLPYARAMQSPWASNRTPNRNGIVGAMCNMPSFVEHGGGVLPDNMVAGSAPLTPHPPPNAHSKNLNYPQFGPPPLDLGKGTGTQQHPQQNHATRSTGPHTKRVATPRTAKATPKVSCPLSPVCSSAVYDQPVAVGPRCCAAVVVSFTFRPPFLPPDPTSSSLHAAAGPPRTLRLQAAYALFALAVLAALGIIHSFVVDPASGVVNSQFLWQCGCVNARDETLTYLVLGSGFGVMHAVQVCA